MSRFIVTVRLPRSPNHNPRNKQKGECPLTHGFCTDITGEHHSTIIEAPSIERAVYEMCTKYGHNIHITRIERID